MTELYKTHRPNKLKRIVGQDDAVQILQSYIKEGNLPHAILFHGASGCGKTTLARILQKELNCDEFDFTELNVADFSGVDTIRNMRSQLGLSPVRGDCRIWLIDECHQMSSAAQNALLKMLEDTPSHVYFFLATTNPEKLLKTVRNRCTDIRVLELDRSDSTQLIKSVCKKESIKLEEDVLEKIIEFAEGSARKALVYLDSIINIKGEKERLNAIEKIAESRDGFALAKLLFKRGVTWKEVGAMLKILESDAEKTRWVVMGYARTILLNGGKMADVAAVVIDAFEDNFYDSKQNGLALACYNVVKR